MPTDVDKAEVVRAIGAERDRTLALLRSLELAQWDLDTDLPGWRVREVVAHLITTDRAAVNGTLALQVMRSTDKLERWNDRQVVKWADRPPTELLLALERWGRRFRRLARTVPGAVYRMPMRTMYGRGRAGLLLWARPFDEWVHRQDIRRALAMPEEEADLAPIAGFVLATIPSATLPEVDCRGTVAVELEGVPLRPWVFDLGARSVLDEPAEQAGSRVSVNGTRFVVTAAGRGTFADLEAEGALRVEGDRAAADALLAKLRIV
ncbi:MAG: maleylpyruvate isomerase family mycothiol-dependent enzyme [Actinomycetota bacterium]|nr:maleylpyruvate isomerase family mycothiol-dependent enzyme [Actinomycetota bacterium]